LLSAILPSHTDALAQGLRNAPREVSVPVGWPGATLQAVWAKLGIPSAQAPDPAALFCSTLVGLVVAEATGIRLWSDPNHQPLLPANLAAHPDLDPVLLEWRNT
jgi:hypothetical protein